MDGVRLTRGDGAAWLALVFAGATTQNAAALNWVLVSMNAPDRLPIPTIGSARVFDRRCEKRDDEAWVDARRSDPRSRFLLLVDLKVAIESKHRPAA